MDAWLKNWVDELDEGYERLKAAKKEGEERAPHPNVFRRLLSAVGVTRPSPLDESGESL